MANEQDRKVIADWVARITDGTKRQRHYVNANVYTGDGGTVIYSYGLHFTMGMVLTARDDNGNPWVWLNGDRYSPTTTSHQSELRTALLRAGINTIVVPGEALTAARIDPVTIVPIHVESERFDYTEHVSGDAPGYAAPDPRWGYVSYGSRHIGHPSAPEHWTRPPRPGNTQEDTLANTDTFVGVTTGGNESSYQQAVYTDGINYRWHTVKHWLGDAVFTADTRGTFDRDPRTGVPFVSSFDKQETRPLYFLSELPATPTTVEHGIRLLMPESVATAIDYGRHVVRQGDMFAIPVGVSTRQLKSDGAVFEKKTRVVVSHRTEHVPHPVVNGDGWHVTEPTDNGRMPRCKVCYTWVHNTPTPERMPQCTHNEYRVERVPVYGIAGASIMGTAHTATEVATLPDGRQYARGCLYHAPSVIGERWRDADHKRQSLGKGWHLIARNTVPAH